MSLLNMLYSKGPRTDPCSSPIFFFHLVCELLIFTLCFVCEIDSNELKRHSVLLAQDLCLPNQKPLKNSLKQPLQPPSYLCCFYKTVEGSTRHALCCILVKIPLIVVEKA